MKKSNSQDGRSVKKIHPQDRNIAVVINDLTEFFAIRSSIDDLSTRVQVDIYTAPNYSEDMKMETSRYISRLGYSAVERFDKDKKYKVVLEPYPIIDESQLDFEFRIKYRYAPVSVKPFPVCLPEWNIMYDAFIVYSTRDEKIFAAYGKTHIVPYDKFSNFKKNRHVGKPNLLYLPTFGDVSSISSLKEEDVIKIKQTYNLTIKAHHATQFREDERDNYQKIKSLADNFYDSDTPLTDLLADADVVLSDNSSAIFDAIYAGIPVAVFSDIDTLNQRKLGKIDTPQYELVRRGVLPCAENSACISDTIAKAIKSQPLQSDARETLFGTGEDRKENNFSTIIEEYLEKDRHSNPFFATKDILYASWLEGNKAREENISLHEHIENNTQEVDRVKGIYEQSVSWRITRPLRQAKHITKRSRT